MSATVSRGAGSGGAVMGWYQVGEIIHIMGKPWRQPLWTWTEYAREHVSFLKGLARSPLSSPDLRRGLSCGVAARLGCAVSSQQLHRESSSRYTLRAVRPRTAASEIGRA